MRYGVIYLVRNQINGKRYVGQTTTKPDQYWRECHLSRSRQGKVKPLWAAIRKYGESAFTFEVIAEAQNKDELDALEDALIIKLGTMAPNGYNLRGGGASGKLSEETKRNVSRATAAAMNAPEMIEKMRQGTIAQFADPDKRARHRAAYDNPDTKTKISEQNVGKRWISNGTESRVLWLGEEMPEGWNYGASWTTVGASRCQWINNGVECRMSPKCEPIPEGWVPGKLDLKPNARNAGKRWITDGTRNEMIATDAIPPAGWRLGMTRPPRA
jgi:group I intron endonuclease